MEVIAVNADADLTDATLIAGVLEDLEPAPGSESARGFEDLLGVMPPIFGDQLTAAELEIIVQFLVSQQ